MARRQTLSSFQRELARIEPQLARAFQEAIQDVRSTAQRELIVAAIERNDVQAVIDALRLGREFFAPLDARIDRAFVEGAIWQMGQLPKKAGPEGANLVIRFDQRNPRAERWTQERGAALVTEITEDQRVAIRETVLEGVEAGRSAQRISRDLIGTRSGNQRKGGVVGLHSRDAAAVRRAREELSDPDTMRAYLRRQNAPWKRSVEAALRKGSPLTATQIERIARSYGDKLLRDRGQRIARTEAHNAFSAGRHEATMQLVESGQVPPTAVKLIWQATPDRRTRDPHRMMEGQTVAYGQPFISPTGAMLMFPGDTSLGAGGEDTINCRCGVRSEIDFVALAR